MCTKINIFLDVLVSVLWHFQSGVRLPLWFWMSCCSETDRLVYDDRVFGGMITAAYCLLLLSSWTPVVVFCSIVPHLVMVVVLSSTELVNNLSSRDTRTSTAMAANKMRKGAHLLWLLFMSRSCKRLASS